MANFDLADKERAHNEGLYAFNPNDGGGETYAGIARNFWPKWKGWTIIDNIKVRNGKTAKIINAYAKQNANLAAYESEFYKTNFWYPLNLQLMNDQALATNVYDFGVNTGIAASAKRLQRAANAVGATLVVDGDIGPATMRAVNTLNAKAVYDAFNGFRKAYYDDIIARRPSQAEFRASWYSRIKPYKFIA